VEQAVVVVFTITPREDVPVADYEATSARMVELVSAMPGFIGMDYGESEGRELLVEHRELALSTEIGIEKIDVPGLAPTTIPAFAELVEAQLGQLGEVDLHTLRTKPVDGKEPT
jgi:hypothetical protein